MRLYLSSYNFGNHPDELFKLIKGKKVALITNAADLFPYEGTKERIDSDKIFFAEHKCEARVLDLRDYFNKQDELESKLREFDLIWVRGANVFVLRRAMQYSGMDKVLLKLLDEDIIAYGGFSAGACVLSNSLRGLDLVDDKDSVPESYKEEIVWDGLNILPYVFLPHYKSDHPESPLIDEAIEYLNKKNIEYRTFKDGQALVINGSEERIV